MRTDAFDAQYHSNRRLSRLANGHPLLSIPIHIQTNQRQMLAATGPDRNPPAATYRLGPRPTGPDAVGPAGGSAGCSGSSFSELAAVVFSERGMFEARVAEREAGMIVRFPRGVEDDDREADFASGPAPLAALVDSVDTDSSAVTMGTPEAGS